MTKKDFHQAMREKAVEATQDALERASEYALEAEVMAYALYELECDHDITLEDALEYALKQWDL